MTVFQEDFLQTIVNVNWGGAPPDIFYIISSADKSNQNLPWLPMRCTITDSNCGLDRFVLFDTSLELLSTGVPAPAPPTQPPPIETIKPTSPVTSKMSAQYRMWRFDVQKLTQALPDATREQINVINLDKIKKAFPDLTTLIITCTFTFGGHNDVLSFFIVAAQIGWSSKATMVNMPDAFTGPANAQFIALLGMAPHSSFTVTIPLGNPDGASITF